ncbi:MAG: chitobiase/beta-hexosaminidase C-terminal domain-containing protein [Bacteroidales bacterium]|nr:chitobiase/beta-hexosaminidase C-terminal domain-containing protein [Bacteroidales bacterium]
MERNLNTKHVFLFIILLLTPCVLSAVEMPEFSHTRGFYDTPFDLRLTSIAKNSMIRYTLDGSKPDQYNGIVYDGLIHVSNITTVRAITIVNDSVSDVRTHTFIFANDVINQDNSGVPVPQHDQDHVYWTEEFDMNDVTQTEDEIKEAFEDIPTISIVAAYDSLFGVSGILRGQNLMEGSGGKAGDPNDPGWHEMVECSVEMIYPENEKLGNYKSWQENAGIKVQGGGGRWNNGYYDHKQSFTLEFKSRYGAGTLRNDVFMAAPFNNASSPGRFDKIILRAGHNKSWGADWDRANSVYTRDQFGRDLQLLMSGWGSHGTFVHLYINGKYWGLYNPSERMDDNAMSIYFGREDDDYYFGKGKGGDQTGNDDRYDYLCSKDWSSVQLPELADYLAINEYIDLCLLYCYSNPGDGPQYYFGNRNNPPGPAYFTAWDIEDSFEGGSRRTGPPVSIEKLGMSGDDRFQVYFKVKQNMDFKMKFADRAYKHCYNNGVLTDANAVAVWNSLCCFIEKAILCEIARWGDERGSLYDYDHWHKEVQDVKDDIQGRANKMIAALKSANMYPSVQPPQFLDGSQIIRDDSIRTGAGFRLTIQRAGSSGMIYYTMDGNDPRSWDLSGNALPEAQQITADNETVSVNQHSVIKARSKDANVWSPLQELIILTEPTTSITRNETNGNAGSDLLLSQNYPNPFDYATEIAFTIHKRMHIHLKVFNGQGQIVETLVDEELEAGSYNYSFIARNLTSGIYYYIIQSGNEIQTGKMVLMKCP